MGLLQAACWAMSWAVSWAVSWAGEAQGGARSTCGAALDLSAIEREIAAAEATLSRTGLDPLAAWDRLAAAAGCAGAPVTPELAARLHRAAATAMWRADRPAAATAAAASTEGLELPEAIEALRLEAPDAGSRQFQAGDGWLQVDGLYAARLELGRAALIQRLDEEGTVTGSWYYLPGAGPGGAPSEIPAEIEALLEPEALTRASGWAGIAAAGVGGAGSGAAGGAARVGLRWGGRTGLLATAGIGGGAGSARIDGATAPLLATWGGAGLALSIQGERAGAWIGPAWSLRAGWEGSPGEAHALAAAWGPGAEAGALIGAGRAAGLAWGGAYATGAGWYAAGGAGVALRW